LDVGIVGGSTVGNPTVVTTDGKHLLQTGDKAFIFGVVGSVPDINGERIATRITDTTFSIPVNVTTSGTGGRVTQIPQPLKDAESELAGQLLIQDRTLDDEVILKGISSIKAGSVAISFRGGVVVQVIPDAVYNLIPVSWLTPELFEPAIAALFDVVSE